MAQNSGGSRKRKATTSVATTRAKRHRVPLCAFTPEYIPVQVLHVVSLRSVRKFNNIYICSLLYMFIFIFITKNRCILNK